LKQPGHQLVACGGLRRFKVLLLLSASTNSNPEATIEAIG
jgi:hypothetical protein